MTDRETRSFQTRFSSLADFAQLPWFALRGDRLVLADDTVGPSIDMHTHLALSYIRHGRVDLHAAHRRAELYLSVEAEHDLDPYANKNFTPDALQALRRDLTLGSLRSGGMSQTHTIPNLQQDMADMGVRHSALLPIDFPIASRNAWTWLEATRGNPAFVPFGSVHPYARDAVGKLKAQKEGGVQGIKIHPAVQMVSPDNRRQRRLCHHCARLGLPVLFHCGPVGIEPKAGRMRSQVYLYEKVIAENPDLVVILGHSGALQMETALGFSRRYSNIWLELSSQGLGAVRTILDKADPDRVVFGSDWPFYHQALPLAKVLIATDGAPELRHKVLWTNAAKLLGLGDAAG